ncbi:hypothetical protein KI387_027596, partial [Taxus chinensis]
MDFEDDKDVTSVLVFKDEEGCLATIDDDLDMIDLDGGRTPKIDLIGGTNGDLVFGDEDHGFNKRGDAFPV